MEICIRWGFKESVHLSLSILPIQQSINKYFEPQSLFSRHQQGGRVVSAGISIALCNKRSCSFTWKCCLIFMRMTALYNYRTTTWPLGDSIKSISQTEQKKKAPQAFVLESLDAVMYLDGASAWVALACSTHGSRLAPGLLEWWKDFCQIFWTNLGAAELSPEWRKFIVLGVCVVKKGSVLFRSITAGFGSMDLRQCCVLRLSLQCEKTEWQWGWGSGCSHQTRRSNMWEASYRSKKKAHRHHLVPWGAAVSSQTGQREWPALQISLF